MLKVREIKRVQGNGERDKNKEKEQEMKRKKYSEKQKGHVPLQLVFLGIYLLGYTLVDDCLCLFST